MIFVANKPVGIVHWHAEIRRKLLILCTECSKKLTQIVTFSAPNVLDPLPALKHATNHKQCLALRPKIPELKRFINIQKCRSSTKLDHCAMCREFSFTETFGSTMYLGLHPPEGLKGMKKMFICVFEL